MLDYYDIRNGLYRWVIKKLMRKAYPCFDWCYFMQLIADRMKMASVDYGKYCLSTDREQSSKEMLIISEYADRLANGRAWEELDKKWPNHKNIFLKIEALEHEYMDAMFRIINRKMKSWWW